MPALKAKNDPVSSQESASLVKRLAGPSTGKAGLAKDQTEINRIIAEASKGSKFYENEKRKDKDLTERIKRILRQRDDVLAGIDMDKVATSVDHLIIEEESKRDLSQTIVHVDMDAFFANVELLHNPELKGKPFGVGYGVLTTASYEARKFGVRSGMPGFIAKKLCPELIFVANTFSRYSDMSNRVMSIFKRFDPNMSPAGCDEAYLNITAYCKTHDLAAEDCIQDMRAMIYKETGLTVSAGIAPNKLLAKICSDKNKPNGQFCLPFDSRTITIFMRDLSIRKVPGIGRVNERLLEAIGVKTCGDIYTHRATISLLDKEFGLKFLIRTYLGIGSNLVQPHQRAERKSIGAERTFSPLSDPVKILQRLDEVAMELESDMRQNGWSGRTVTLKYKLDTYQVFTRAKSFDHWITKKEDLYATGRELLQPEFPLTIRLIGLRVTKLKDLTAQPLPSNGIKRFFEPSRNGSPQKRPRVDKEIDIHTSSELQGSSGNHNEWNSGLDDSMPGFHEQDEADDDMFHESCIVPSEDAANNTARSRPRPPMSAPALLPNTINSGSTSTASTRLHRRRASDAVRSRSLVAHGNPRTTKCEPIACPICGMALETDNQGLNSHIDFCLSRDTIRQAHAEATSPSNKRGAPVWQWPKAKQDVQTTKIGSKKK